jgi:predicted transcriptional regulator
LTASIFASSIPRSRNSSGRPERTIMELEVAKLATTIVASYVARNPLPMADLPRLIHTTAASLCRLVGSGRTPAVPANQSVFDDYIICLEDGVRCKLLALHLRRRFKMSPDEYREKWGLPASYPMIPATYSKHRAERQARYLATHKPNRFAGSPLPLTNGHSPPPEGGP